MKRFLEF